MLIRSFIMGQFVEAIYVLIIFWISSERDVS